MKKTRTPLRKAMALALSCTMALGMAPAAAFAEAIEPDDVTVEQIDVEDQAEGLVAEEDGVATLEEEMLIEGDGDAIAPEASDEAVAENGTITAQSQWRGSTDLSDGYFFLLDGDTGGSKDYYVKEGGSVTPTVTVYYYSDDEEGDSEGRVLLDPSKYELGFYKWNDETGDWDIPTSTPLYAASTGYLVVATAKSGSGLTGSCDVCFNVYGPYDLLGATLEFPGIGAGNRVDAGKTLTPVVKINGAVVPSSGYTLEYESEDTDEITTTFPTAVGKYYVYVEGVEPYKNWVYGIIYVCAPISSATVSSVAAQTYTGKAIRPKPTIKLGGKTLKLNTDYTLSYKNNTKVGTATITITGSGNYGGTKRVTFKISKAANPMRVKAVKRTVKAASVKKKAVTVARPMTVTKAQGKVTYAKVAKGSAKCLTVNKTTGKVTVKKGTKKGTYTIKVKVKAAGNANYKAGSKTVTCKVAVK